MGAYSPGYRVRYIAQYIFSLLANKIRLLSTFDRARTKTLLSRTLYQLPNLFNKRLGTLALDFLVYFRNKKFQPVAECIIALIKILVLCLDPFNDFLLTIFFCIIFFYLMKKNR